MRETVHTFWTGGYDSSFRICQLSRKDVIIQPYYMSDNRHSESFELKAIDTITKKLIADPDTKAEFKPLIIVSMSERKKNPEITKAYRSLLKQYFLGSQYEWLAIFALEHKGVELSIHEGAINIIKQQGQIRKVEGSYGSYYEVDPEHSTKDIITIFGNMRFPIVEYSKPQMKDLYVEMGCGDIINDTWFCHTPYKGEPCGCCNPCRCTIQEGLDWRFTPAGLERYKKNENSLKFKVKRKVKRFGKVTLLKIISR